MTERLHIREAGPGYRASATTSRGPAERSCINRTSWQNLGLIEYNPLVIHPHALVAFFCLRDGTLFAHVSTFVRIASSEYAARTTSLREKVTK